MRPVPRELYPFEGRYLDLGGVRMHYLDEGRGDAGGDASTATRPGRSTTASSSTALRDTPPGDRARPHRLRPVGQARRRALPLHAWRAASTTSRRCSTTSALENLTLVVHDWGGMIGIGWAARHPERCDRLVVLNTAALPPAGREAAAVAAVARPQHAARARCSCAASTPSRAAPPRQRVHAEAAVARGAGRLLCALRQLGEPARGAALRAGHPAASRATRPTSRCPRIEAGLGALADRADADLLGRARLRLRPPLPRRVAQRSSRRPRSTSSRTAATTCSRTRRRRSSRSCGASSARQPPSK